MAEELFREYEQLVAGADAAFQKMEREHGDRIRCALHCVDCCYAVFGLFLIESVYLKQLFDELGANEKAAALLRADKADKALAALEKSLKEQDDPQLQSYALARERIRCPLLNERDECILYPFRPITCRVYGIPTAIGGRAFVCGQAGFEEGQSYPTFDLDAVYRSLHRLSKELLVRAGETDLERADFLVSVSKTLKSSLEELIRLRD
ncbi:MAG: hypothetical protein AB1441_06625 [Bacillota bacterium]